MRQPIEKISYWKYRVDKSFERDAKHENDDLKHESVYLVNQDEWERIAEEHKKILGQYRDKKVLDAGCGYGRSSEWFTNYVGIDFSPDFIEKAKELYPDKEFIIGDLKKLPFKDNEFDIAICVSIKNMVVGQLGGAVWDKMEKELLRVAKEVLLLEYTDPSIFNKLN